LTAIRRKVEPEADPETTVVPSFTADRTVPTRRATGAAERAVFPVANSRKALRASSMGKRRFVTLHQTIHHVTPHQQDLLYADDHETLSRSTRQLFEQEANHGAAGLLSQRDRFARDAADLEISTASIWLLAERYGSSFHTAIHRYAETHPGIMAAIVWRGPHESRPPHGTTGLDGRCGRS
jgi:hypothetical protein